MLVLTGEYRRGRSGEAGACEFHESEMQLAGKVTVTGIGIGIGIGIAIAIAIATTMEYSYKLTECTVP